MKSNQTIFYIVRHGETDWNAKKILQGQQNIPLNALGEKQARELAKVFKNINFSMAFTSDLLRAKRTTEIIAAEHDLEVETTDLLRERRFGTLEGKPSKLYLDYIKLLLKYSDEERLRHKHNPDFESDEIFTSRILTFLRETAIAHPGKTILVGAHGGVFHSVMRHLGVYSYKDSYRYRLNNTGYVKIATDGVEFQVQEFSGVHERANASQL